MRFERGSEQIGERCPTGPQRVVLCAIHDVGLQEGYEGKVQRKSVLVFESEHRNTKGAPFVLFKTVTASLFKEAFLAKVFGAIVRRAPTDNEADNGFDDALLVGKTCYVNVAPPAKENGWPSIETVMPLPTGFAPLTPQGDYGPDAELPKFVQTMLSNRVSAPRPAAPTATPPASAPASTSPTSAPPF